MNKIILNCCPPAKIEMPSPALSALKSYLVKNQQETEIIYWNLILYSLQCEFLWNNRRYIENYGFILYYFYIAQKKKDKCLYNYLKYIIKSLRPEFMLEDYDFYENHIMTYLKKLDILIDEHIKEINPNKKDIWGFTLRFDQWIIASIIAEKIKKLNSNAIILVGGINTKEAAIAFIRNFRCFDIAMYGEGEESILKLKKIIDQNIYKKITTVPNIAYRNDEDCICTSCQNSNYPDLTEELGFPDFSDFFHARRKYEIYSEVWISIEGSRGCHWNKCHFCYLNEGYKYREKKVSRIIEEIVYMMGV